MIRNTKTLCFMHCPYLYNLIYNKLIYKRKKDARMYLGTIIHKAYEQALLKHFEGNQQAHDILDAGHAAIDSYESEDKKDAHAIFERSFRRLGVLEGKWQTMMDIQGNPMIEYDIELDIGEKEPAGITVDWVARYVPNNVVFAVDFKTRKNSIAIDDEETQYQLPFYMYCLNEGKTNLGSKVLQDKIHGMAIYEIMSRQESVPKITLKGRLSKVLGRMDPETLLKFADENELPESDYMDAVLSLKPVDELKFFYKSGNELELLMSDFLFFADMASNSKAYPRHMSAYNCRGCSHRSLCQGELRGEDIEDMIETEFVIGDQNAN